MPELTDDEREALWAGIRRARHEDAPIPLAQEVHKTHVLWAMSEAVERIVRERMAQAWDEGYDAALRDHFDGSGGPNPYHEEADRG